ncbi:MAG: flavin reductase family protein [Pseudomonadota bacterium]
MPDGGAALTNRFTPGPDNARAFRDALGCFATGVTVVTAKGPGGPVAITVNSFSSVSLDPALVLWSPGKSSRRHDIFLDAEQFVIHVLADDQRPVADGCVKNPAPFDALGATIGADGIPRFSGCLARFECDHFAAHDAGDHTIIVGKVTLAETCPGAPLLFARGQYGRFTGAK